MGYYARKHSSMDEESLRREARRYSSALMEEEARRHSSTAPSEEDVAARRHSSMGEANGGAGASPVRVVTSLAHGDISGGIDEDSPATAEEATPLDARIDYLREEDDEEYDEDKDEASSRPGLLDSAQRRSVWKFEKYELPFSTYTFLLAERCFSKPFFMGILALTLSAMSLSIVLINEINNGTADSPYGLPAGVPTEVRIAQYLGIIIGVLMEEEVPLGLEIMGKAVEQHMFGKRPHKLSKVFVSSILRMAIGYLFLACLFFTVIQENDVLNIFFDVLALEFVENIDDVLYALSRRGFFGKNLKYATYKTHAFDPPGDASTHTFARWMKGFVRFVYFFNGGLMLLGLTYFMVRQNSGAYRCHFITVSFSDDVWEDSWIKLEGGGYEKRLLIYSHFNGIYVENGTHDGRPKYTEMNKENGEPFDHTIPAEIIYCDALEAWVFRHEKISTSPADEDEENECSWLLRSPETESFDIIEVAQEKNLWMVWTGEIVDDYSITITCNECYEDAGCNYHGDCIDQRCDCDEGHFGSHCEYERPCEVIRSEKDPNTTLHLLHDSADDDDHFVEVYGHPKYVANMAGIPYNVMKLKPTDDSFSDDDFFEIHTEMDSFQELLKNYTFVLKYTGRRWYGQIKPFGVDAEGFVEEEYHAYWNNAFSGLGIDDNATVIISAPTTHASPVGVDFFEMRRRNKAFEDGIHDYDYSPFGVLIPAIGAEGAGYFHCNKDD